MKIVKTWETWIHTYFALDTWRLSTEEMQNIKSEIETELKNLGIVYGIHFEDSSEGCCIVLECIPFPESQRVIVEFINDLVKDMKPRPKHGKRKERKRNKEAEILRDNVGEG